MLYLGWIVAGFLGGLLLALTLWRHEKRRSLRANFSRLEVFQGRSYQEIWAMANQAPSTLIQKADGSALATWRETGYCITLDFNAQGLCLGVVDEQIT